MAVVHLLVDDEYIQSFIDTLDREKIKIVEKDFEKNKKLFEEVFQSYINSDIDFFPYYHGVRDIYKSSIYDSQLEEILAGIRSIDESISKQFAMYLNTVILNMQTKLNKYKKSIYFNNEHIKDIEFQGCTIPFLVDEPNKKIILLGISAKS